MKTTIYFIRHSEPMSKANIIENNDTLQIMNEKNPLSINGEKKAEDLSKIKEMKDIDIVIASNYVRSMATAKYIASENTKELNIVESFSERKHGINAWSELPENFELKQMEDKFFKMPDGENREEVAIRMHESLFKVLRENKGKRIAIVSHATAIMFLFMKLGTYKNKKLYFNNQIVIDEDFKWNAPEVFKLDFEDEKLISIQNIKW